MKVNHFGDKYVIEIVNPTEYESYVEFGHRTRNHAGWTQGKFMMTIAATEIEKASHEILERRISKWLKGTLK